MEHILQDYLSAPDKKRSATLQLLFNQPDAAFEALVSFRGPYPADLPIMDVFPDYIQPLLADLIKRFPRLLLERDLLKLEPGKRQTLLTIAIESALPQFGSIIVAALKDRSTYARELAIEGVARLQFLRTPESKVQLQKLLRLKSMRYCRDKIQNALNKFKIDESGGD